MKFEYRYVTRKNAVGHAAPGANEAGIIDLERVFTLIWRPCQVHLL